ncbi:hypothetical protein FB567DRAFT_613244 [Paraphoma chrysanthemicola]|uniref:Fungal calcium binding protein domain-containing protein n=1 Tax=Paraphoma chrysanthemicola TaxID=798071 RepID=A0A8K0QV77_9PLEO|nr:hypothetical protein FB567DRAFT_613244 [Paraphoma chrysanthemicola]
MRPSTLLISALAAITTASPTSLAIRDTQQTADAIRFAAVAADCSILKCATVIASAACIAASIGLGPAGVPGALGCVAGGSAAICPCAGCVDALNNFLVENKICEK